MIFADRQFPDCRFYAHKTPSLLCSLTFQHRQLPFWRKFRELKSDQFWTINILPSFRLKAKGSCNCRIPFPFKISVFVPFLRTYSVCRQTHGRTPQSAAFRHSRLFPSSRQRINAAILTGNSNTGQQYCRDMPSCCLSSSCLSPLTLPDPSCEFFKIGGHNFARQKGTAALKATVPMHFTNALLSGYTSAYAP